MVIKAGVLPERIAPGKPQENGRLERLHLTLLQDTASPPAATLRDQAKRFQAFRWDAGTGVVPLGTPDSLAYAINNRGEVVGQDRVDGQGHAVLWIPASN